MATHSKMPHGPGAPGRKAGSAPAIDEKNPDPSRNGKKQRNPRGELITPPRTTDVNRPGFVTDPNRTPRGLYVPPPTGSVQPGFVQDPVRTPRGQYVPPPN